MANMMMIGNPHRTVDWNELDDLPVDAFSCDHFRMFEFKVRRCTRGRSHDWTECPYSHPGEKASRRDPRKFRYSGTACPEFRNGECGKGDLCEYAHGVFECWLHPARYRTQPCKDSTHCRRRVCFFAHTPDQMRVVFPNENRHDLYDELPSQLVIESSTLSPSQLVLDSFSSSPTSILSPPMSPLAASMKNLQMGPRSFKSPGLGSSMLRPAFLSVPSTPIRKPTRSGLDVFEEPIMERVESGRSIRAKIYESVCKESFGNMGGSDPDVGWVSELVK